MNEDKELPHWKELDIDKKELPHWTEQDMDSGYYWVYATAVSSHPIIAEWNNAIKAWSFIGLSGSFRIGTKGPKLIKKVDDSPDID